MREAMQVERTSQPRTLTGLWLAAVAGGIAAYAVTCVLVGARTGFHVGLNDFWGIRHYARHLSVSDPESLYNGFYPIGYPMLLRLVGGAESIPSAFALGAVMACLTLAAAAWFCWRIAGPAAALMAVAAVGIHPAQFAYATTPAPDQAAAALVTWGCALVLASLSDPEPRTRCIVAGGLLLGLAGLMRFHALALGFPLLLAAAVSSSRRRRPALYAVLAMAIVYGVQVSASLVAGHGPFETAQAVNVEKMLSGIDWYRVQPAAGSFPSVGSVILLAPVRFATTYVRFLAPLAILLLPSIAIAWLAIDERHRTMGAVTGVGLGLYVAAVAAGGSSRAAVPAMPLVLSLCSLLPFVLAPRAHYGGPRRLLAVLPVVMVAAVYAASSFASNVGTTKVRGSAHTTYGQIEELIVADRPTVSPGEVFASDFDFYLPNRPPHAVRRNGGWPRYHLHGYAAGQPDLCVETLGCFVRDCRRQGITHVVLTVTAGYLSVELGRAYDGHLDAIGALQPIGQSSGLKVFRVLSE